MKKLLMALLALVLVGGGVYWFVIRDSSSNDDTDKTTTKKLTTSDVIKVALITYTDEGFVPDTYIAGVNAKLTVQNDSTSDLDFESNDHPTHTKNTELNVGVVKPGENKTVTLTEKGEWGFHNHLNSTHTGTITVE